MNALLRPFFGLVLYTCKRNKFKLCTNSERGDIYFQVRNSRKFKVHVTIVRSKRTSLFRFST